MPRQAYYRYLFLVSAFFNILLAASGLIMQIGQLELSHNSLLPGWQFPIGYSYFVLIFGIGYYFVSKDIHSNHGIVKIGILGKAGVFIIFMTDFIWGAGTLFTTLIATADLLFGFLFLEFLYAYRRHYQVIKS